MNIDENGNNRRRLRNSKLLYNVMSDNDLANELDQLLFDIDKIKIQINEAKERRKDLRTPIDMEWFEKANNAISYKNKQVQRIRHEANRRRKDTNERLMAAQIENSKLNSELKTKRHEMNTVASMFQDTIFVQICSEIFDRELYLGIWDKVNERMAQKNEKTNS